MPLPQPGHARERSRLHLIYVTESGGSTPPSRGGMCQQEQFLVGPHQTERAAGIAEGVRPLFVDEQLLPDELEAVAVVVEEHINPCSPIPPDQ